MRDHETLYQSTVSRRTLPVNVDEADLDLFRHELERVIPATDLIHLKEITVYPDGILFRGRDALPESFPSPLHTGAIGLKAKLRNLFRKMLFRNRGEKEEGDVYWITDTWSTQYFHWMADALPRLLAVRGKACSATLMLPGTLEKKEYVLSSLEPFELKEVRFVKSTVQCSNFNIPTHTAPPGNYNDSLIQNLRKLYTDYYKISDSDSIYKRIYISRGKAKRRKIANEDAVIQVLKEYGFVAVYFEDHSFEQQVALVSQAQYLIGNHGAGLTNMLFMKPEGSVLELRQKGDSHNNCFFSLASALKLRYYYQICCSEHANEDAHTANLVVDCHYLKRNIELMLSAGDAK